MEFWWSWLSLQMLQIFLCSIFWLPLLTRSFLSPLKVCGFDDPPRRARSKVTLEKIRSIKYLAYANVCHSFSMFFYRYSLTCDHLPPTEPPTFLFDNSGLGESASRRSLIGAGLHHKFHMHGAAPPLLPSKQKKPKRNRKPMDQNRGPKATCQTIHTLRLDSPNQRIKENCWQSKPISPVAK